MRALAKLILSLILVGPLAIAVLAWFMLADAPTVAGGLRLSHEDIARVRDILAANDPRRLREGQTRTITVPAQELDLAARYLARQLIGGTARTTLGERELHLQASRTLSLLPLRNVLNLDARIHAGDGEVQIAGMRIGDVPVPGPLATWFARRLIDAAYRRAGIDPQTEVVHGIEITEDRLQLTYRWHPGLIEEARDSLLTSVDRDALRFYHERLVSLQAQGTGKHGPLVALLEPLFASALERSSGHEPVAENTALLTVLGAWASRQPLHGLVPAELPRPRSFRLKLHNRADFAQHFLISAALAARGDGALSDAVGLFKEIADSDRGSGFSFTDIAADRSGTRFGELATRSRADARRLQQRLAAGIRDGELMPAAADLPEHMDAGTFKARFDAIGSPAYQQVMAEIERRIDALPLYRD